jgi:predicted O-methyltransferase YrrM
MELKAAAHADFVTKKDKYQKGMRGLVDWLAEHHNGMTDFASEVKVIPEAAKLVRPGTAALELGSWCGARAIRLLAELPSGPSLVLVDRMNDDDIVKFLLKQHGVQPEREVVSFMENSGHLLNTEKKSSRYNSEQNVAFRARGPFGFVVMDQDVPTKWDDLLALDSLGLLTDGAIIYAKAHLDEYMKYGEMVEFAKEHPKFTHIGGAGGDLWKYSKTGASTTMPPPTPPPTPPPPTPPPPTPFPTAQPTFTPPTPLPTTSLSEEREIDL